MPTIADYPFGAGPMPAVHESLDRRVARLERNLANVAADLARTQQFLEDNHVLENSAFGRSAWTRVTNLWNILLREGVTRTGY